MPRRRQSTLERLDRRFHETIAVECRPGRGGPQDAVAVHRHGRASGGQPVAGRAAEGAGPDLSGGALPGDPDRPGTPGGEAPHPTTGLKCVLLVGERVHAADDVLAPAGAARIDPEHDVAHDARGAARLGETPAVRDLEVERLDAGRAVTTLARPGLPRDEVAAGRREPAGLAGRVAPEQPFGVAARHVVVPDAGHVGAPVALLPVDPGVAGRQAERLLGPCRAGPRRRTRWWRSRSSRPRLAAGRAGAPWSTPDTPARQPWRGTRPLPAVWISRLHLPAAGRRPERPCVRSLPRGTRLVFPVPGVQNVARRSSGDERQAETRSSRRGWGRGSL